MRSRAWTLDSLDQTMFGSHYIHVGRRRQEQLLLTAMQRWSRTHDVKGGPCFSLWDQPALLLFSRTAKPLNKQPYPERLIQLASGLVTQPPIIPAPDPLSWPSVLKACFHLSGKSVIVPRSTGTASELDAFGAPPIMCISGSGRRGPGMAKTRKERGRPLKPSRRSCEPESLLEAVRVCE